jgi:hypothetical protein
LALLRRVLRRRGAVYLITSQDVSYPAKRESKLAWPFKWVIVPGAVVALLVAGAIGIGPAVAAKLGHGTHGYFVPEQFNCGNGCKWLGNFALPGGKIVRHGVSLDNPHGPLSLGEPVPALDTGAQGTVFPPSGGRLWILMLIELLTGIAIAGLWIWRVPVRRLRRRRRRRRGVPVRTLRRRWRRRRLPDFLMPEV